MYRDDIKSQHAHTLQNENRFSGYKLFPKEDLLIKGCYKQFRVPKVNCCATNNNFDGLYVCITVIYVTTLRVYRNMITSRIGNEWTSEPRVCFKSLPFLKEQTTGETNGTDAEVGHA